MLLVLFVVGLTLPVVAVNIWTFGIVLAVGGTVIAPIAALEYQAVQRFAPDGTVAAAFTWLVVASIAGSAIGAQLGGAVVNVSTAWGFAAAGVVSVVATGIAYLARSRIATQKVESG
jgi:predicted MFS family arabinose efflux permease